MALQCNSGKSSGQESVHVALLIKKTIVAIRYDSQTHFGVDWLWSPHGRPLMKYTTGSFSELTGEPKMV